MKINASKLREWNTQFEFSVKVNISDCSTYPLTLKELFCIVDEKSKKEYQELNLRYTKTWGDDFLRQEIAKTFRKIDPQNILITNGGIEAIFLIMNALSNRGDEMISFFPVYQALFQVAKTNGTKIKWWKLNEKNNFSPDLNQLEKLITPKTKAIIINQPHVPTGFIFNKKNYKKLIEIAKQYNLYLISDEVCRWLYLEKESEVPPAVDLYEKAISIGDLSKPFGAGGLRIGWLACQNKKILEDCLPLRGYTTMSNSAPSEYLATLILRNKEKLLKPRLKIAKKNYRLLRKFIKKNPDKLSIIKPKGGVTAFPKLNLKKSSTEFCRDFIKKQNTLLVPGEIYGVPDRFRIGFGCQTNIFNEGLSHLQKYFNSL